jgi:translation elongation factor EF-Tu-like GTPase
MFQLTVEDIFRIKNRGVVATGRVASGVVSVGDTVLAGGAPLVVMGVEKFRKVTDSAAEGENVGLLFDDAAHDVLTRGAVLTGDGVATAGRGARPAATEDLQHRIGLGKPPRKRRWFGRG